MNGKRGRIGFGKQTTFLLAVFWALMALLVAAPGLSAAGGDDLRNELGELNVYFFDVGQGASALLKGPDFTILIDAGRHDRSDVLPHLQAAGVESIDLFVLTHPHADHIGQCVPVMERFPVREVWMSGDVHTSRTFERCLDAILRSDAGYHEPRAGEVFQIGAARLEVVHPAEVTGHLNNGSIALRVAFGQVAFLFTGDGEREAEREMMARGHELAAHVLHLGHHGSRTSSTRAFLEAVRPQVAVYSAGAGNRYGHPHPEVVRRVERLGIALYGTDVNGTVRIDTDGYTFRVTPERGEAREFSPTPAESAGAADVAAGGEAELWSEEEVTPLVGRALAPATPVPFSDGRVHLAYELLLTNTLPVPVELTAVEVLDGDRGSSLRRFHGEELATLTRALGSQEFSRSIPPGGTAVVWMDVALAEDGEVPAHLAHRLTTAFDADLVPGPPPVTAQQGPRVAVEGTPVVIGPPLRGSRWLVLNGCCIPPSNHRGAVLPLNGELYAAERFAIDFVQLDPEMRMVSGDPEALDSYPFYGADILAVADGTVVRVFNEVEENERVGQLRVPITSRTIGGNYVILDIGGGSYAFYAHLEPDSIQVRPGDRVRRGDVIARLGNTGNSTMPHLHLHILEVPAVLAGNGVAYVFDGYRLQGYLSPDTGEEAFLGEPVKISPLPAHQSPEQRGTLPLDMALVDFGN